MIINVIQSPDPFARIPNKTLCDKRLSYRARGVLAYLLSKPHDWTVRSEDIVNNGTEGRDMIRTCFRELKKLGYARLEPTKGGGSQWIVCGQVEVDPLKSDMSRDAKNPDVGKNGIYTNKREYKQTTEPAIGDLVHNQADRVAALFKRRRTTPWSAKEVSAWKKLTAKGKRPLDDDELTMIERYYAEARKKSDNYCRRDVYQFLNNYAGEVDRARNWCEKHPLLGARKVRPPVVVSEKLPPPDPEESRPFLEKMERETGRLPYGWKREGGKFVFTGNGAKEGLPGDPAEYGDS